MEFKKVFHIGKKDNFWYNLHVVMRRHIYTCIVVFLALLMIVSLFSLFTTDRGNLGGAVLKGLLMGLVGVLLWNVYIIGCKIYLRLNNMYKKGKLTDFKQEILLDKNGITATTASGSNQTAYKYVVRNEETRHAFYLVMNETFAYTLPKDQMTAGEITQVQSILNKNLPNSKKGKRGKR
ncbi:MAG: YcxB family protein [Clostridia bacterium]|nr:YcxB family protein [Clostridia bacterium]